MKSYVTTRSFSDLQETVFKTVQKIHLSGANSAGAERCVWETYIKACSWNSKMNNVVKYDVHLDRLLMVPMYVIYELIVFFHVDA